MGGSPVSKIPRGLHIAAHSRAFCFGVIFCGCILKYSGHIAEEVCLLFIKNHFRSHFFSEFEEDNLEIDYVCFLPFAL